MPSIETFSARSAWWQWAVLFVVTISICLLLINELRAPAVDIGPSPALPPIQGDIPDGFDGRRDTPHFVLLWRQGETTDEEIDTAAARAEHLFARLAAELGPVRTPEARLSILFEGDGLSPTGTLQLTHYDKAGRIHCFRYPGSGRG